MNIPTWIVLAILALWLLLALRYMYTHKGSSSGCSECTENTARCSGKCDSCHLREQTPKV